MMLNLYGHIGMYIFIPFQNLNSMDKIDYQITDQLCEQALIELDVSAPDVWIIKHKALFERISIKPNGLPSIANQYYEGVKYSFIGKFHSKYQQS
jgi:hypothetical protein